MRTLLSLAAVLIGTLYVLNLGASHHDTGATTSTSRPGTSPRRASGSSSGATRAYHGQRVSCEWQS